MPATNLLDISLVASDGSNHIYLSNDTSLNVLTLTFTNPNADSLYFQQYSGSNCSIGQLGSTDTGIYLLFNGMLANSEIASITCNKPGWTLSHFSDAQSCNYIVLTSQSNIQLAPGETLSFELQLPAISGTATSGYFSCQCVNVLYTYPRNFGQQLYITKVYPPRQDGTAAAQLPIQFEFIGSNIISNNNTSNSLSFRITNTSSEALVPGGKASWGTSPPQFTFYFIQDDSSASGSVVTNSQARSTHIGIADNYDNKLKITQDADSVPVVWIIEEDETLSNPNGTILGTGKSASISFSISELYTNVPSGISMAVLEYSGFPGYPDGQLTAEIEIVARPVINQFYSNPSSINIINTGNPFNLLYQVTNASSVYIYKNTSTYITGLTNPNQNSLYSFSTYITHSTAFTLVAINSAGEKVSATIVVQVDTVPIGSIVMWSGALSTIPTSSGWRICDGTNGTPDLRERFILGASGDSSSNLINNPHPGTLHYLGATGGITSHSHSVTTYQQSGSNTDSGGSHQHYMNFDGTRTVDDTKSTSSNNTYFHGGNTGNHDTWWYTETNLSQYDGSHSHSLTIPGLTGTTSAIDTTPPYYALYFIMKCV